MGVKSTVFKNNHSLNLVLVQLWSGIVIYIHPVAYSPTLYTTQIIQNRRKLVILISDHQRPLAAAAAIRLSTFFT